jgi:GntR family transcriptional regulator, transcriptional repressor for pyruvate dehydrogenase complex
MTVKEKKFLSHIKEVSVEKPSDVIINQIRKLISDGILEPGQKLPPERVLVESFGVGRGHIRQALKKLEFYGILETLPQDGTYVAGLGVKSIEGLIRNILKLNANDIHSLLETRAILEIEAIRLTCQRASNQQIAEIQEAHLDFVAKVKENQTGLEEDIIFHHKIAEFTQNSVLYSMITLLTPELLKFSCEQRSCKNQRPKTAMDEHDKIMGALLERDSESCIEYMRKHMQNTLMNFQIK